MAHEEQGRDLGRIIAKAWADEAFKRRLLADPAAVLKEEGMSGPEGMEIKAVENTDKVYHLVIPQKPRPRDLSDEALGAVVGGSLRSDIEQFSEKLHKLIFCWDRQK